MYGSLRAVGTEADSIIFTSTENNPNDWEGIEVLESASSNAVLSHCVVEYAYEGIKLYSPYPDTVTYSTFRNNEMGGIIWENDSDGIISHNHVFFDTALYLWNFGITLRKIRSGMSSSLVTENSITNYYEGLYIDDCSTKVSSNSISNAGYRGVCVMEQYPTSFPSYVILNNISVTGNLDEYGFYINWNHGYVKLEYCRVLPNADNGPEIGVIFQNDLTPNIYSMRVCEIKDFTWRGVYCHWYTTADLGTEDDKGYNQIFSDIDSAWYVWADGGYRSLDSTYAQYNWWGEYPPDSNRFHGPVVYMPALTSELGIPDSMQEKLAHDENVPKEFQLLQNYPNPFNPVTSIQFTVGSHQSPVHTTLKIYNILGQLVKTLVDEEKNEGSYIVHWDARNMKGETLSSGIYFYRLESGEFTDVKKMVLLR